VVSASSSSRHDEVGVDVHNLLLTSSEAEGPEGNFVNLLNLWDLRTWAPVASLKCSIHENMVTGVNCVAFSADNALLAAGVEGVAIIWDLATLCEVARVRQDDHHIDSLCFPHKNNNSLISLCGITRAHIVVWDLLSNQQQYDVSLGTGNATDVALSLDDAKIVCRLGHSLYFTDFTTSGHIGRFFLGPHGFKTYHTVCASPSDADEIAVVAADGDVFLLSMTTQQKKLETRIDSVHQSSTSVRSCCYSRDGGRLYLCTEEGIIVYDIVTGESRILVETTEELQTFALSPDGTTLVIRVGDSLAEIYNAESGAPIATLEGQTWKVVGFSSAPSVILM
jgi:WD40 repeat protein